MYKISKKKKQGPTVKHSKLYSIFFNKLKCKKKSEKRMYIHLDWISFPIYLNLRYHCKLSILQFLKISKPSYLGMLLTKNKQNKTYE